MELFSIRIQRTFQLVSTYLTVNTYGLPIEMRMNIPVHERIKI